MLASASSRGKERIMVRKAAATPRDDHGARKQAGRKRSPPRMTTDEPRDAARDDQRSSEAKTQRAAPMPDYGDMSKMAKTMTTEQTLDMYKPNAALAHEVINSAIEGTRNLRRKRL